MKPRPARIEDFPLVRVLDSWNDVKRSERNARISLFLELSQRLFRSRIRDPLVLLHALDDDVRGEGEPDLDMRVCAPHLFHHGVDRLLARLPEGRAEAHDEDGVTLLAAGKGRLLRHEEAEARRSTQSLSCRPNPFMECVSYMCHKSSAFLPSRFFL